MLFEIAGNSSTVHLTCAERSMVVEQDLWPNEVDDHRPTRFQNTANAFGGLPTLPGTFNGEDVNKKL